MRVAYHAEEERYREKAPRCGPGNNVATVLEKFSQSG